MKMTRNTTFRTPSHEPLREHTSLSLHQASVTGPLSFLNPTCARFSHSAIPDHNEKGQPQDVEEPDPNIPSASCEPPTTSSSITFKWRSRDNRKGRHTLVVKPPSSVSTTDAAPIILPSSTTTLKATLRGTLRMLIYYPYWDISYLVAVVFTLGSVVWVFNGFFVWLPLAQPSTEFPDEIAGGGGWTAFIGATVFEFGSLLLMLEAVNENRAGCFGWALEKVVEDVEGRGGEKLRSSPDKQTCSHHHTNKKNLVGKPSPSSPSTKSQNPSQSPSPSEKTQPTHDDTAPSWQWFPSLHSLYTHYLHSIGFLACAFQTLGATIFWISGFTALPSILAVLSSSPSPAPVSGAYWAPQIAGGLGFIVSSLLFMLETQRRWYIPAPGVLGWWIGVWNLVGAVGFTLCGILGVLPPGTGGLTAEEWAYQASLATFWGSWAFLIGSVVQWYESLGKWPVEIEGG